MNTLQSMELVAAADYETGIERDPMPTEYCDFRDGEGIPVHTGIYVDDVNELGTDYWERTGQRGAFINLFGMEGVDDIQINEIEPGGETTKQKHFYEEIVYVTKGRGMTTVGEEDGETFEWSKNSVFFLPKNVPYRHSNASGDKPARLLSQTPLPLLMMLVKDNEFFFNTDYVHSENHQYDGFYDAVGEETTHHTDKYDGQTNPAAWDANFIPDITKFDKGKPWDILGGIDIAFLPFPMSSMSGHLTDFPVGRYKTAHRHSPGANVFIRSGQHGFTLIWHPDWEDKRVKIEWSPGSLFTPPGAWYHQQFNTGSEPAGQLALHPPGLGTIETHGIFDPHHPMNVISYVDEDPAIREHYESQLAVYGNESDMPEACFTDPDFSFEDGI